MVSSLAAWLVPLCLAACPAGDEDDGSVPVSGRIVDAAGQPVAGATAGTDWGFDRRRPPYAYAGLEADDEGHFSGSIAAHGFPVTLEAYSEDGELAGFTRIEDADGTRDVRIVLQPSVRLVGEVTRSGLEEPLTSAQLMVIVDGVARFNAVVWGGSAFEVRVPRGDLSWTLYDDWFSMVKGEHALEPDEVEVDIGRVDIPAAFLAKHVGKQLPEWTVSASRGVPLDESSLEAHRGKWLLIEFWGYW